MPSLAVDDTTSFFYLDSGKPQQETYTTLVILHAHGFHSNSFKRLFPLAPLKGLRLICVDRRDYGHTTLYTPAELKALQDPTSEAEFASFMDARGVEIAIFIDHLIDALSLPPPLANGKDGGIGLLGVSIGNVTGIVTVAAAAHIPASIYPRLKVYLRRLVLLASPSRALGIADPPNGYLPFTDDTIPLAARGPAFMEWVSSYFTHGDLSKKDPTALNTRTPDIGRKSTVSSMSPEDITSTADFAPGDRSELFFSGNAALLSKLAHKALFDPAGRKEWPNLDIWFVYGDKEPWIVPYASWAVAEGVKSSGRELKTYIIPGANHLMYWDAPEGTIEAFAYSAHN